MTASNLGMVFGPTLMRPEQADQEPFDIEHQKIIIEMMISEMETVNVCVCVWAPKQYQSHSSLASLEDCLAVFLTEVSLLFLLRVLCC